MKTKGTTIVMMIVSFIVLYLLFSFLRAEMQKIATWDNHLFISFANFLLLAICFAVPTLLWIRYKKLNKKEE